MSNFEAVDLEDFRILSDAITYLSNKHYENALINVKKVAGKCEDLKGKNKLNECYKIRCSKVEEFRYCLMIIGAKLKSTIENLDKCEHQIISMLNFAIILHFNHENSYCGKVLDKIQKQKYLLDDYSYVQYIYLRLENYLNVQSPNLALKLIESEISLKDDNKFTNESDKSCLDLFRLRATIQSNNYSDATKVLERVKRSGNSMVLWFIEGSFLYFTRKIPEALLHFTSIASNIETTFDKEQFYYWNNLGCVNFHLNKHNIGIMYFNRSLNAIVSPNKRNKTMINNQKDVPFGQYYEAIHNLGVQLLFANKPVEAFDLLLEVVNVYPKNPRLWFRLAECCVKAYRIGETDIYSMTNCVQSVIGVESYKKVILGNESKECKKPWEDVAAMPTPTLEFGSLCIRNAMFLLPSHTIENSDGNLESVIEWYKKQCIYVHPGGCIRDMEILHLRSSILLNGAYISLTLNNYVEAFRFSEKLLKQPILSPIQKYIARMYMSESLLMMNIPTESIALLNPSTITSISRNPEVHVDSNKEMFDSRMVLSQCNFIPTTLDEAQGIMYYNLAVVYAILRQDKMVEQCLTEALKLNSAINKSAYYINLIVYLELFRGKTKSSLHILGDVFSQIPLINNVEV